MHSNYNLLTLSDSRLLNSNGQTIYYKERIEGRNMKITDTIKYVGVNDHQVDLLRDSMQCQTEWHIIPM